MNALLSTLISAATGARGAAGATGAGQGNAPAAPAGFGSLLSAALGSLLGGQATAGEAGGETAEQATELTAEAAAAAAAAAGQGATAASLAATSGAAGEPGVAASLAAAEMPDAASAEAEALATAAAHQPYRGMDRLDGEFRARFERVVERMQDEFGHRVEVVETWRDNARQELLFQQGRSQPGPVVTWTRNSNHLSGRAADVIIDDSYGNPAAYARLAQIAQEEGLRTLGARDPGHVELPRAAGGELRAAANPAGTAAMANAGGLAQVARVAPVARVAQVAQVARVAQPGRVGSVGSTAAAALRSEGAGQTGAASLELGRLDAVVPGLSAADVRQEGIAAAAAEARSTEGVEEALAAEAANAAADAAREGAHAADGAGTSRAGSPAGAEPARGGVQGAAALERLARVMELQADLATRPMQSMVLRVEGTNGLEDRIRVDLRGSGVEATLDMGSLPDATRLGARVEDLSRALERQGLEAEVVRIRSTQQVTDAVELSRVAAAAGEGQMQVGGARAGSESGLGRDRGQGDSAEQQRSRPDDSNHRSRREPKEEKNP